MTHRLLRVTGRLFWWFAWPAMWLRLQDSHRTRLVLMDAQGRILVVKGFISGSNRWSLPGGGLHRHEKPLVGLIREMYEEVGVILEPEQLASLGNQQCKSKGFRFNLHFFEATITEDPVLKLQRFEIAEAAWVDPRALNARNAEPDAVSIIATLVPSD